MSKGWTSHGHKIPGIPVIWEERPSRIMRCGGTSLCAQCQSEAETARPHPKAVINPPQLASVMAALARPSDFVERPKAFLSAEDALRWQAEAVLLALAAYGREGRSQ